MTPRPDNHSTDCVAATAKWFDRMIGQDHDKCTAHMSTVIREAPEDVVAWLACPNVSHDTVRLAFKGLSRTMLAARDIATTAGL